MNLRDVYGSRLLGSMKGLDRIRFRGTLRWLAHEQGIRTFWGSQGRLLKDFGKWAERLTRRVRTSCEDQAKSFQVPTVYLRKGGVDKEQLARELAQKHGLADQSICLLSAVEPCIAPMIRGNHAEQTIELCMGQRQCVWLYHYFDDPQLGFGHVRLQSWLPFTAQICLNGRHWLEKQLLQQGIGYLKDGNCFPYVEDLAAAQRLLDEQLRTDWPKLLNRLLLMACPALSEVLAPLEPRYYWSADETEFATDFLFRSPGALAEIYPVLIRQATVVADSPSVLRYFGKRNVTASGKIMGKAPKELFSDYRQRVEGVRLKHRLNQNSIKMYDKSGSILRVETTINKTREFKVFRQPDDDPQRPPSWQKMRKGVADLHRRCVISDQCNQRYEQALAAIHVQTALREVAHDTCNRLSKGGKRYRAINPWRCDDFQLLTFLGQGQWAINGFCNRDLRTYLFPHSDTTDRTTRRRLSARATRLIRLLRGHGLIRKVPRANRYVLTTKGQTFSTALLAAGAVDVQRLMELAS